MVERELVGTSGGVLSTETTGEVIPIDFAVFVGGWTADADGTDSEDAFGTSNSGGRVYAKAN